MPNRPHLRFPGLSNAAATLAGLALVLIILITVASSASRFFLGFPIPDAEALCEMLLVAAVHYTRA